MTSLLLFLAASIAPAPPPCADVTGERILGIHLARVLPAFAALPADLAIGYAPQPGLRRILPPEQLARLAQEHGIPDQPWPSVCFVFPLAPIADADVVASMRDALGGARASIQLENVLPRLAPAGKILFPLTALQPPRPGEPASVWRGFVQYSPTRRYPLSARVRVATSAARVVAAAPLAVGKPIAIESIRLETVEGFPGSARQAGTLEEVAGRIPRRTLDRGSVILLSELTTPPDILKGDRVQVEVRNGGARLVLDAQAQAPGHAGDTIPVKNLQSGRNFPARVEGKGKVAVTLKGNLP